MDTLFELKIKKSARSSSSSSSPPTDWASLPEELLELILHHINQLSEYLRFAAVCKPWLLAANHQRDHRQREIHKQVVPMLLIHSPDQKTEAKEAWDYRRRLYSVTENKIHSRLELRVPYRRRCCGSSHGWLATVNEEDLGITLLNPFSGRTLSLPKVNRTISIPPRDILQNMNMTLKRLFCHVGIPLRMNLWLFQFIVCAVLWPTSNQAAANIGLT
ncbi:hypothetical protein RHGRI_017958 [Rhododendron griersonianum]|uniref:F-box domain-containing protein n=1 Tax=Rhododendron griersonianum TaxID=479676 RepID=A0AAV6JZQ8_9ERIC|nr:hypothetical protein RHGRI_017958 [Rhododendron griersonianum]